MPYHNYQSILKLFHQERIIETQVNISVIKNIDRGLSRY